MVDRNTAIRRSQLKPIQYDDLDATNAAVDNYVPSYDEATGKFTWIAVAGGISNLPDLGDVDFDSGTPADDYIMRYDSASGKWKAEALTISVDKIEEGDSLVEVVDAGSGEIHFKVDNAEQMRLIDGKWYPITDNDIDIGDATHRIKDLYITGNLSDGSDTATVANLKDAVDKKHTSGSETMGGDISGTVGNASVKIDDFTIKKVSNELKIADRIELNILLNAFRIAINGSLTQFDMIDGIVDEFEDESGVDTGASTFEDYDATNDLYKPGMTFSSNVKLVLHFDGSDGATSTTDSSQSEHILSNFGTVQLDTEFKKWGTTASLHDGDSDYWTIPDSTDWDCFANDTDDWTIHFQLRCADHVGNEALLYHWENNDNRWGFSHVHGSGLTLFMKSGGAEVINISGGEIDDTNWHHISICKVGSDIGIYKDGIQVVYKDFIGEGDTFTGTFRIGARNGDYHFYGSIDELVIVKSNIFSAAPNNTPDDTITEPTGAYAPDTLANMTLISQSTIAEAQPDNTRIVLFEEDVDAITENTDLKAYISRDGGTTWTQVTLADEGDYESGKRILTATSDISGQPSGTSMEWKVTTHNAKDLKLHGIGLLWD